MSKSRGAVCPTIITVKETKPTLKNIEDDMPITQQQLSTRLMPLYEQLMREQGVELVDIDPITAERLAVTEGRLALILNRLVELNR